MDQTKEQFAFTEMSPVRTREIADRVASSIAAKSAHVVIKSSFCVSANPESSERGFYDEGWLISGVRHSSNRINAEIVDQAQRMSAVWPDEYMCTVRLLPP